VGRPGGGGAGPNQEAAHDLNTLGVVSQVASCTLPRRRVRGRAGGQYALRTKLKGGRCWCRVVWLPSPPCLRPLAEPPAHRALWTRPGWLSPCCLPEEAEASYG
jgi:hypothetical protein